MKLLIAFLMFALLCPGAMATTIAFDGSILAADSQGTTGNRKCFGEKKIYHLPEKQVYVACAGEMRHNAEFLDWYTGEKQLPSDWTAKSVFMVVHYNGNIELYIGKITDPQSEKAPFALGSGQDFAFGAMAAGKNAIEAVEIASNLEIHTGGPITSFVVCPITQK